MTLPRFEVVFRKGLPRAALLHFVEEGSGRSNKQIPISPPLVAHYTVDGRPSGLEVPLPLVTSLQQINEALAELGQPRLVEADLAQLRAG